MDGRILSALLESIIGKGNHFIARFHWGWIAELGWLFRVLVREDFFPLSSRKCQDFLGRRKGRNSFSILGFGSIRDVAGIYHSFGMHVAIHRTNPTKRETNDATGNG